MNENIKRILERFPYLKERKLGFPEVGKRNDNQDFSPYVKGVKEAFSIYDRILSNNFDSNKDINMTSGNPINYKPYPPIINELSNYLLSSELYKYPYSECDNNIRKVLLNYIEKIGLINNEPYDYDDIDEKGLSINNLTLTVSTSHAFNIILDIIARAHDVILMTAPNYGLFSFKPERLGIDVEIIELNKNDNYLINPHNLEEKIIEINKKLKEKYKALDYVPKVVAFVNSNPNNPTGKVMGKKEFEILKRIGMICKNNDVFIIDDIIYRDICFDEKNIALPLATIPGMFKNTISLIGLSKSYGLASLRAGFVVADEVIIREVINGIFREMDAVPAIIGVALKGAFLENTYEYEKYFNYVRHQYELNYNVFKAMINGLDSVNNNYKNEVKNKILEINKDYNYYLQNGIKYVDIKIEPEAGFFVILEFTSLKNHKYLNNTICTEEDLLNFFYDTVNLRFLIGKSFAWPNKEELVGRFTFAKEIKELVNCVIKIDEAIKKLDL